jgi:ubiquinone/menaquinone biosynthesis C-methylase UbiE
MTGDDGMRRSHRHPLFARLYARMSPEAEAKGASELRDETLAGASGRVAELGAGNGLNLDHYPASVTEVVAVEPEPYLRRVCENAAKQAAVPVTVLDGAAGGLPLESASIDVGVASLVLCSVDDQHRALAELARVIRPGGELRFLEHVLAQTPSLRRVQRAVDATVWPLLAGGCHTARDTLSAIKDAGFAVSSLRRLRFPDTRIPTPTAPSILGIADR